MGTQWEKNSNFFLWDTIKDFINDYCDYLPFSVPRVNKCPSPNKFLRDYVQTNLPFVIKGDESAFFPAVELWKDQRYLRTLMDNKKVSVAVTPDGRADSIVDDRFMVPEERTMSFNNFLDKLYSHENDQVYYLQKQNNNLLEEFSPLIKDVGSHIPWATEAFSSLPDAVNIWIGNKQSVTSVHRDNYENLYFVIRGEKKVHLFPPVSIAWMPYKKFKKYQWFYDGSSAKKEKWQMRNLNEEVYWVEPSHKPESLNQFKVFADTKKYEINLVPGDMLYIPSLWFHEVHQTNMCIAVNYWYDMKMDFKYPFLNLLEKLCTQQNFRKSVSVE